MPIAEVSGPGERPLDHADAQAPVRVLIVYDDVAAGQKAMEMLADLRHRIGVPSCFEPVPWSFGMVADVGWGAVAALDAATADVVVVASSAEVRTLPGPVVRWIGSVLGGLREGSAAVVALFTCKGIHDGDDSPRLRWVRRLAAQAGLECFAPKGVTGLQSASKGLRHRAEAVTPLLERLLRHEPRGMP